MRSSTGAADADEGLPGIQQDLQEDKESLFDAVKTVIACLEAMTILYGGLNFALTRKAVAQTLMLQMSRIWQREVFPSGSLQPRG